MPRVYNKRHGDAPANAIYVGRPTKWGNPYVIGKDGTREVVIDKYRALLLSMPPHALTLALAPLRGKDLVCWCSPDVCHADVLMELANK